MANSATVETELLELEERFWQAMKEGVWPRNLMEAALCRSHTLTPAREGFNNPYPSVDDMQRLVKNPVAYRYEHLDGLKCSILLMEGDSPLALEAFRDQGTPVA